MTKLQAISFFGGGSDGIGALTKELKITRHAVYQWGDPIPLLREFQIDSWLARNSAKRGRNQAGVKGG